MSKLDLGGHRTEADSRGPIVRELSWSGHSDHK